MNLIATLILLFLATMPAYAMDQAFAGTQRTQIHTVTVGSFHTDENAQYILTKIKHQGFNPKILKIYDSKGKLWTVIHIGKYIKLADAEQMASRYKKQTGKKATIIHKSKKQIHEFEKRVTDFKVQLGISSRLSKINKTNNNATKTSELQHKVIKLSENLVKESPIPVARVAKKADESTPDIKIAIKEAKNSLPDESSKKPEQAISVSDASLEAKNSKEPEQAISVDVASLETKKSLPDESSKEPEQAISVDDASLETKKSLPDPITKEPEQTVSADDASLEAKNSSHDENSKEPEQAVSVEDTSLETKNSLPDPSSKEPEKAVSAEDAIEETEQSLPSIEDEVAKKSTIDNPDNATNSVEGVIPIVNFTQSFSAVSEGELLTVTLKLNSPSNQDISVPIVVTGTATLGMDFFLISHNPVVIPAGETTAEISFSVTTDWNQDDKETVTLKIASPKHAEAGTTNVHTSTITDISN
ncbi:MAG: SPOR domain-containing protein [Magnetococcales bacterium]|nr:SPOR domain-containing protein [Magnetococcales bacterium]